MSNIFSTSDLQNILCGYVFKLFQKYPTFYNKLIGFIEEHKDALALDFDYTTLTKGIIMLIYKSSYTISISMIDAYMEDVKKEYFKKLFKSATNEDGVCGFCPRYTLEYFDKCGQLSSELFDYLILSFYVFNLSYEVLIEMDNEKDTKFFEACIDVFMEFLRTLDNELSLMNYH